MSSTTRCPHCSYTFSVDEKQLKDSGGAVRCADCNEVFNGEDNLIIDDENTGGLDESILDGDDLDGESDPSLKFRFEDYPLEEDDDEIVVDPSSTMRKSFKDGADSLVDAAPEGDQEFELSDAFMNIGEGNEYEIEDAPSGDASSDESWANALLADEEDDEEEEVIDLSNASVDMTDKADDGLLMAASTLKQKQEDTITANKEESNKSEPKPESKSKPKPQTNKPKPTPEPASAVTPPPAKKKTPPPAEQQPKLKVRRVRRGGSPLKAIGICALLVILAVGQILWFNHERLVKHPDFRPAYDSVCDAIGCKIPKQENLSLIKHSNLIVRGHPDYRNTLIVETLLRNNASFSQPYPDLELSFVDELGTVVSRRRLNANQYLHQDAAKRPMPSKHSVHLSFSIADPGKEAGRSMIAVLPAK